MDKGGKLDLTLTLAKIYYKHYKQFGSDIYFTKTLSQHNFNMNKNTDVTTIWVNIFRFRLYL